MDQQTDDLVDQLGKDHPAWRFWRAGRSDGGRGDVYGSRRHHLSKAEETAGLVPTLPAGFAMTPAQHTTLLLRQLAQQRDIAERLDGRG